MKKATKLLRIIAVILSCSFAAHSQTSITDYAPCVDYFGDATNQNNPVNIEFMNRVFGTNYESITNNSNPGHITGSFLGCRSGCSATCGNGDANTHKGLDIRATANVTPVYSPVGGIIDRSSGPPNCDDRVIVKVNNDPNLKLIFLHLNTIVVNHGASINPGTLIGYSGTQYSTGTSCSSVSQHLHVELRYSPNNNASATCVTCSNNYDPRLIVKLFPINREINNGLEIYGGTPSNKQQLKIWFNLDGVVDNNFSITDVQLINPNIYATSISSSLLSSKEGCSGVGRFTIDLPSVSDIYPTHDAKYDISFKINGVPFFGKQQVFFFNPDEFQDPELSSQSWLKPYVDKGVSYGFFKGTSPTSYSSNANLTRGQAAKVIALAAIKLGTISYNIGGPALSNISPIHWSFPYMQTLKNAGVIQEGNPDFPVQAGEFAKMIVLAMNLSSSDINVNSVNNGNGLSGSKLNLVCCNSSLQQYMDILNGIMLVREFNGRYRIEPLSGGIYNTLSSELLGSQVQANGCNPVNRSLMAKALVGAYEYYKDKIGSFNPCHSGPQFLNVFNNDFSQFTAIGDKFELTATPSGSISLQTSTQSVIMESGEVRDFGTDLDNINGFPLHTYWSVDGGKLTSLFPSGNHKKARFIAPTVSVPTDITLYRYVGCGNGLAAEVFYNITVYPTGQQPNTTTPTVQSTNLQITGATTSSISLSWTRGNGQNCIVTCTEVGANAIDVPDPGVVYSGNSNYNSAAPLFGGSDTRVVYTGTNNSLTVTGLLSNTSYRFAVHEYNGSTPQNVQYRITNPAYGVGTTLQPTPPPNPPGAYFVWPGPVVAGQSVTFQNMSTGATSYSWTFQGGTPATSTATNPSVIFAAPGTYNVVLTSFNSSTGLTNQQISQVEVVNPADIMPDLAIQNTESSSSTYVINSSGTISYSAANYGYPYYENQPTHTKFYLSLNATYEQGQDYYFNSGDFVHQTAVNPGTPQSGTSTLTFSQTISIINDNGPGQYYVIIMVDGADVLNESNENNNYYAVPITLVNGIPNLTYDNQTLNVSTINSGGIVTASWKLKNTSTTTVLGTQNISTSFYLSSDNIISADDIPVASDYQYMSLFPSSSSSQINRNISIPAYINSNSYYLLAIIDEYNNIAETDESDNTFSWLITVSNPTQPAVQASNMEVSNITDSGCRLTWANGNGNARVVVVSTSLPNWQQGDAYNGAPRDGTSYAANSDFTIAESVNTANPPMKVVFDGTGDFVEITGLSTNVDYHFTVFEYNNTGNGKDYLISHNTAGYSGNGYEKGVVAKIAQNVPYSQGFYHLSNQYMSEAWDKSVRFVNDSLGWGVHLSYIHKTSDAGKSWFYSELSSDAYTSCYFIGNNGWLGGASGSFVITLDGGLNWTKINTTIGYWIRAIQFTDLNTGYLATGNDGSGNGGGLFKTVDGGYNWTQILATPRGLSTVDVKGSTIVVSGIGGVVMKSLDGGNSWTSHNLPNFGLITAYNFLPNGNIKATCQSVSNLFKSVDGGNSWQTSSAPLTNTYSAFLNDSLGWIGSSAGLAKTIDGGESFIPYLGSVPGATEIAVPSEKTAYVFNSSGVYKTISGGENTFVFKPTYNQQACGNNEVAINFNVNQSFNVGNQFTVQLSNASGGFSNPTAIGTIQGTGANTIDWSIPGNFPSGSGYRVRVVASDPPYVSEPGNPIAIQPSVPIDISLTQDTFYTNSSIVNLIPLGTPSGGNFTIDGTPTTVIDPAQLSLGQHSLSYTVESGVSYAYSSSNLNDYNGGMAGIVTYPRCDNGQSTTYTGVVGLEMQVTNLSSGNFAFQMRRTDQGVFQSTGKFEVRDLTTGNCWDMNTASGVQTHSLTANVPDFNGTHQFIGLFRSSSIGNDFHAGMADITGIGTADCVSEITREITILQPPVIGLNNLSASSICPGQTVTFNYSSVSINPQNTFAIELSDANGDFTSPMILQTEPGNNSIGSITVTIPVYVPTGSNYRLRMISDSPLTESNESTPFTVTNINTPTATITSSETTICEGEEVIFSSMTDFGGNNPVFEWQLNGQTIGGNTATFVSSVFSDGDVVILKLTSNDGCVSPSSVYSQSVTLNVLPNQTPTVSAYAPENICQGTVAEFNAYSSGGGNNPLFDWYVNGQLALSGNSEFLSQTLLNNDTVTVLLTSSAECVTYDTSSYSIIMGILPTPESVLTESVCSGETFAGYSQTGTFTDVFIGANGCDSTRTLNLTVLPNITSTVTQSICAGQTYLGYSATGVYTDTFTAQDGCDSTRTLDLTVLPAITSTVTQSICYGDTYLGYSTTGTYTDTFTSQGGCDSTRTLDLTVLPAITSTVTQSICAGDTYLGYSATGVYTDTFTAQNGCDSTRTLDLTVMPAIITTVTQSICTGQTYLGYSATGIYTDSFTAQNGCDSTRTLDLTVASAIISTITQSICAGESLEGYSTTGFYTDTFTAQGGCDSTRTLDLTVLPAITSIITESICDGEIYEGYSSTGQYTDIFVLGNGCDSTRVLNLTVEPLPSIPTITDQGNYLESSYPTGNQWYLDGDSLVGETGQVLNNPAAGEYTVEYTDANGCTSISDPFVVLITSIRSASEASRFEVFPNPNNGSFTVQYTGKRNLSLRLMDAVGRIVSVERINPQSNNSAVEFHGITAGMYLLEGTTDNGVVIERVVVK